MTRAPRLDICAVSICAAILVCCWPILFAMCCSGRVRRWAAGGDGE